MRLRVKKNKSIVVFSGQQTMYKCGSENITISPIWGSIIIIYITIISLCICFFLYNVIKEVCKPDRTSNEETENIEIISFNETHQIEGSNV